MTVTRSDVSPLTPGELVRPKPWFRGVYANALGTVRLTRPDGTVEVDIPGDPIPWNRLFYRHELERDR